MQLQDQAIANSPVLKRIDQSVTQIDERIQAAVKANKTSLKLAVFEPGIQYFLRSGSVPVVTSGPNNTQVATTRPTGFVDNVVSIFTDPRGSLNGLLAAIGVPIFKWITNSGTPQDRAQQIAITDLRVKLEELKKSKAEIADRIRDKLQLWVLEFDVSAREFQIQQLIARRDQQRYDLYKLQYRFGQGDTASFLQKQSELDRSRLTVLSKWGDMRSKLERIKLVVFAKIQED